MAKNKVTAVFIASISIATAGVLALRSWLNRIERNHHEMWE
jgi:hypothetical protein